MNNPDPWNHLRSLTAARIALGRSGGSLPTRERLDFQLAHARARDAVLAPFDAEELGARLRKCPQPVMVAHSAARNRAEYLRRPDLGRALLPESRATIAEYAAHSAACDLVIIVSDGLSAHAAVTQCEPLLAAFLPMAGASGWSLAPVIVARHARVALQDEIGALLKARVSLILLGERPGLGSADSLGAYFTHGPFKTRTDADRNCVSNIREGGISTADAARKLHYLIGKSLALGISGVRLKDESPALSAGPRPGELE
ncbi:MAG TPA: ethanolamine ammonia-lyase subunit EutC [Chthoniobacteraceae bacterium]|nr:ethanolamine ammonia-lyase subunit EutC [Chthoniobacteraceae bacterium]